jgi:hypothetical protein
MRQYRRYANAALALVVLAACSTDRVQAPSVTEPTILQPAAPGVVASGPAEAATVVATGELPNGVQADVVGTNITYYSFWVDGDHDKTVLLGTHMVVFPAYTICDPNSSNYGPSYWLQACAKLTTRIQINATTWTDPNGRPQVDFDRHIRFYPNWSGELPAIYLRDPAAALTSWGRVDYCSSSTSCVDEAASDPVLATKRDPATGYLYRLIRHFSGYLVWD